MSDDLELLKLAADAVGIEYDDYDAERDCNIWYLPDTFSYGAWNPLNDDGDAMRLAVKLQIEPRYTSSFVISGAAVSGADSFKLIQEFYGDHKGNIVSATRRAIVRAAAEIAKARK